MLRAERLPVRRYSTVDGLSGDYVINITKDARGFLWFSTRDGLSRFDGLRFVSYDVFDGLPSATVNMLLQTRDGTYWVATNGGGISRFDPGSTPHFVAYPIGDGVLANRVNSLLEDRAGRLWAATDDGVFVREPGGTGNPFSPVDLRLPGDASRHGAGHMIEDGDGSLWFMGGFGLRRRLPDGRVVAYRIAPDESSDRTIDGLVDIDQRLWISSQRGLHLFTPEPASSFAGRTAPLEAWMPGDAGRRGADSGGGRLYTVKDGLPNDLVTSVHRSGDGQLWVGTARGMASLDGDRFRSYPSSSGLPDSTIADLADDAAGNLWIATVSGVARLIRRGLVTYDETDGLASARVRTIGEGPDGQLEVLTWDFQLNRFDGRRFVSGVMAVPAVATCQWMSPCGYLDRSGGWWMVTTGGLLHWPPRARLAELVGRPPDQTWTTTQGLASSMVFTASGDSRGRIWIGTSPGGISVWDTRTRQLRAFTERDGLPPAAALAGRANAFAEDHAGSIWVGFEGAGLGRFRDNRYEHFRDATGTPATAVTGLYADAAGRLWIGSSQNGLGRLDDPSATEPRVAWLTTADGLASNNVRSIVGGADGRIYAGTSRGVDRLDPATGAIVHFTVSEGLGSQFVTASFRDRRGALWFGTISGLSRLDPIAEPARAGPPAPPVFVSQLRVAGSALPLSELGERAPAPFSLSPTRNQLEIDFFAFNFDSGAPLRYQYRLEGAERTWSAPTELRSVNYAQLAAGSYRFLVRAAWPDGAASTEPAVVAFRVLPPFYARWWFLAASALLLGGAAVVAYRVRVAQLLQVERVRSRIATDLHDDLGASLSQIAILAEVARERLTRTEPDPEAAAPLARIAETSRTLVDSMSDIVWAINPEVDTLSDLVHRMRRFVEDSLGSGDIDVSFVAPATQHDLKLSADVRREVFLILKESVTNIAKHAGCTTVTVELSVDRRRLRLQVSDDGKGFDPDAGTEGNGVASMRRRVAALGGRLTIASAPDRGTTIQLDLDLRRLGSGLSAGLLPR
jgi:signal transduction histidine kinase/ligand-binding sensor domain-containing protein